MGLWTRSDFYSGAIITQLMAEILEKQLVVPDEFTGQRLDKTLAALLPDLSRARLQESIKLGQVTINGQVRRAKDKLLGGELIDLQIEIVEHAEWQAEAIPLDIVFEDEDIIVINKPAGLVVHPAAGNYTGTLVNALLHHDAHLAVLPRAGIVHRIDKDTTGLLVVARSLRAHTRLVEMLQAREIKREYEAIACGEIISGGTVDAPIGRHPQRRTQMAVVVNGKPAVTHYRVLKSYRGYTHLLVQLETGRTHQIRVHMAHIHHPLLGDPVYGQRLRMPAGADASLQQTLRDFKRQALHAAKLGLTHPASGEWLEWRAELPDDLRQMLAALEEDLESHAKA